LVSRLGPASRPNFPAILAALILGSKPSAFQLHENASEPPKKRMKIFCDEPRLVTLREIV